MGRDTLKKPAPKVTQTSGGSAAAFRDTANSGSATAAFFPTKEELAGATVSTERAEIDGKLHLHVLPYCNDLSVYGNPFASGPGICVRMVYAGRPSPLFNFKKVASSYCEDVSASQAFAKDFSELEELYNFKFVYADGSDPDGTGLLLKNAVACFMNEDADKFKEWLLWLDDCVAWRMKDYKEDSERVELREMVVHNYTEMDIQLGEEQGMTCKVSLESGTDTAGVHATDVSPPVFPKRFVLLQLRSANPLRIDLTMSGNCKPYATKLAAKRVPCKSLKRQPSDEYPEKFYTVHDLELNKPENFDFVTKELLSEVFGNCPIVLRVCGPEFEGAAADLLKAIKARTHVHC